MRKLKYIDLFAGCGGLSIGFEKAGFDLELAIEKSDMACETFFHNFIKRIVSNEEWNKYCELTLKEQAKQKLVVNTIRSVLDDNEIMKDLKNKNIDIVMGGPPCQGFSMAGRRNPKDQRNKLAWQFIEFIEKVEPKAVLMENVVGMNRDFKKQGERAPFMQLAKVLTETGCGYDVQPVQLNTKHFGIPEHRPRLMLLALRKDISKKKALRFFNGIYKSDFDNDVNIFLKRPQIVPKAFTFGQNLLLAKNALWDISDTGYKFSISDQKYRSSLGKYALDRRSDNKWMPTFLKRTEGSKLKNQITRNHNERVVERFKLYQLLQNNNINPKLINILSKQNGSHINNRKVLVKELEGIKFPLKSKEGKIFANNIHALELLIIKLNTRKHSQRPIDLEKPAPTMVTLPDDFVHPVSPRILTVREMARIQSFPDSFEFRGKETTGGNKRKFEVPQYTQVGNAVAPELAFHLAKNIRKILD